MNPARGLSLCLPHQLPCPRCPETEPGPYAGHGLVGPHNTRGGYPPLPGAGDSAWGALGLFMYPMLH